VRIGLVENTQRVRQAVRNIKNFMRRSGVNTTSDQNLNQGKEEDT